VATTGGSSYGSAHITGVTKYTQKKLLISSRYKELWRGKSVNRIMFDVKTEKKRASMCPFLVDISSALFAAPPLVPR